MSLQRTFAALSDPTRQKIIELLKKEDMSAGAIGSYFAMTAPSLSHHLAILKQAELVSSRRQGQEIIYSLNISVFEEVTQKIISFLSLSS